MANRIWERVLMKLVLSCSVSNNNREQKGFVRARLG